MRTTTNTARGKPLAVALLFFVLACTSWAVWGEGSLLVEQSLSPAQINVAGMGAKPDAASVSISLLGQGAAGQYPVDCAVVIDTSASAQLAEAKAFAYELIGRLGSSDRVALVTFGVTAELVVPLTDDKTQAKLAVGDLTESNKSALGAGLQLARQELQRYGRENAVLAIVLIADGQNNVGAAPTIEGMVAGETGVRISTVAIVPIINRALLMGLAEQSGGVFVAEPTSENVDVVVDQLEISAAATNITVTKHVPVGLHFAGSTPAAALTRTERDGSTTVTWQIAEVGLGENVRIEARFDASAKGSLATDDLSKVVYRDYRGVIREAALAPLVLSVIMPNRAPIAAFAFEPTAPTASDAVAFRDQSRDLDDEDRITAWHWAFGDGTTSSAAQPDHQYASAGSYGVSLSVTDEHGAQSAAATRTVVVGNGIPVAAFVLRQPETSDVLPAPLAGVDILLDASRSYDVDGTIARYAWDLNGDGDVDEESSDPTLTTSFAGIGEQSIGLVVTDDYGNAAATMATFDVVSSVTVERAIVTHLPNDETIAGSTVEVTLTISANASLQGMIVSETLPEGWTFASVPEGVSELDSPTAKSSTGSAEWIFAERVVAGSANSKRVIRYTLSAPSDTPEDDREFVTLRGTVSSSSPRMAEPTLGEDKITLLKSLPIPVAISCMNTKTKPEAVNLKLFGDRGTIGFDQINYAISLWVSGDDVPSTSGKIDGEMMEELTAYWLTQSSVYDPLP